MPRMASSPTSTRSPPSPSASFYDLSDDEEGEYNTIRHTETGRGVKLLYTKSKVRLRHDSPKRGVTANMSLTGLHPSYPICKRQHRRLYRTRAAEGPEERQ